MNRRFTVDGSDTLEGRIAADLERVRDTVLAVADPQDLTAIILGGGYGRGEGGVCRENGRESPYNDYDLFLVVPFGSRGRRRSMHHRVNAACHPLSHEMGIDVEFGPPLPLASLPTLSYELMMMELKAGHQVVWGDPSALASMPDFDTARVPLHEGARLLLNRAAGLILARRRVATAGASTDDDDLRFVVRNIHKAVMALGDAVLFVHGRYSPSYVRRAETFASLDPSSVPGGEELRSRYAGAIRFKLEPRHGTPPGHTLASWFASTTALYSEVHLWYERHRLGMPALSWAQYQALPSRLPGLPFKTFSNPARNLRAFGWKDALAQWNELTRHPRDWLLAMAPGILYADPDPSLEEMFLRAWTRAN